MGKLDNLGGLRAWIIWGVTTLYVITCFAISIAYGVTSTFIAKDLGLSLAQVGIIASTYTWAVAGVQLFSGSLLDHLGVRILPVVSIFTVLGGLAFANASSFEMLVLANLMLAIGGAFGFVGAGVVGGKWFGLKRFGIMFSLVQAIGAIGSYFNQNAIRYTVETFGWTASLNGLVVLIAIVSVLMFIFIREPRLEDSEPIVWPGFKKLVTQVILCMGQVMVKPRLWLNTLHAGMTFGAHMAVSLVWGPIFLTSVGMSQPEAVAISSFAFAGMLFGCPFWVWLSERIRMNCPITVISAICHALSLLYLISYPETSGALVFFVIGFFSAGTAMNFPIALALVPAKLIGAASSHVNTLQFFWTGVLMAAPGLALSGTGVWAFLAGTRGIDAGNPSLADFQSAMMLIVFAVLVGAVAGLLTKESFNHALVDAEPEPASTPACDCRELV